MPTHSHSTVPHFNGNTVNLYLYFDDEVEALSTDTSLNDQGKI
jgi:hypothetical protein